MGIFLFIAISALIAMSTLQPAPQNLFVLLPEEDGTVGAIEVSNAAGTQLVETANSGVRVGDRTTAPTAPKPVSEAELQREFATVLAAEPLAPVTLNLYFQVGTTELTAASLQTFNELFTILDERVLPDISVVGHTDTTGAADANERLARERADIIANSMIAAGAPGDRMEVTSHGESNLLVLTEDNVAEPLNRRVEISIR